MKKFLLSFPFVYSAFLGIVAFASPPGSGYHLLRKIPLSAAPGGGEDFDYITVDSAARRVYLAHGAEVKVLDADMFSVVVKSSPDTDSIIYDPASKLVFTFTGESKNATVIDPLKETVVKVIDLGGAVEYLVRVISTTTVK
jgi:hypothetical protein